MRRTNQIPYSKCRIEALNRDALDDDDWSAKIVGLANLRSTGFEMGAQDPNNPDVYIVAATSYVAGSYPYVYATKDCEEFWMLEGYADPVIWDMEVDEIKKAVAKFVTEFATL